MNNYYDLPGIDTLMAVTVELEPIGIPTVSLCINRDNIEYAELNSSIIVTNFISLLDPLSVSVVLSNKTYTLEKETAVVIKRLQIDNINILPQYDYLANYINDHDNNNPTSYLGFNGKWTLTIDKPFYQWLHHVQGHGWLLD